MDFSLSSVLGDTWLVYKCLGAKFGDNYSDTPTYEGAIPHRPTQLNRDPSNGLKKEVKSVYNTEIADAFEDLTEIHILLFFLELLF